MKHDELRGALCIATRKPLNHRAGFSYGGP
jgi:hypothetical protein